jgi:deoxyribonuclease V
MGLASHVGLWLDVPTIGVAKSRLCGEHREPGARRRCRTQLKLDGRVIGAVVRTRTGVRPLFISVGHRVTLDDAVRWTLRCTRGVRLPEPNRRAHQRVTCLRRGRQ